MTTRTANPTLAQLLDHHTVAGTLAYPEGDRLRCVACGHRCLLGEGKRGICKVRFVRDGELRVPFGYVAGLRFVYAGNLPGQVGPWENTRCPGCQETLIERFGFHVRSNHLTANDSCPRCRTAIPGLWSTPAATR